jgi:hypothetical protein
MLGVFGTLIGILPVISWRVLPTATTVDNTSDAVPTQYQACMCTAPYPNEQNKSVVVHGEASLQCTPLTSPHPVTARTLSADREPRGLRDCRTWMVAPRRQSDGTNYGRQVSAAARRRRFGFRSPPGEDRAVTTAIASIGEDAWTPICYPKAIFDQQV